jgi:hypothetical protein
MKELDTVVLTRDLPSHGLKAGDVGAIVHMPESGESFEVEFVRADGRTVAVVSLKAADVRLFSGAQILHARKLASA